MCLITCLQLQCLERWLPSSSDSLTAKVKQDHDGEFKEFRDQVEILVFDDLRVTSPPSLQRNGLLMSPNSEFQLGTNRERRGGKVSYKVSLLAKVGAFCRGDRRHAIATHSRFCLLEPPRTA